MKKYKFKPFDRVLVRNDDDEIWRCQLYSHPYADFHVCFNGVHVQCIPYAGNENLLGTTDSPEPELKNGDIVAVWDKNQMLKKIRVYSHYDAMRGKHAVYAFTDCLGFWDHAEKFIPATVEG